MQQKKHQNFFPCKNTKLYQLIPALITSVSLSYSLTTCSRPQRVNAVEKIAAHKFFTFQSKTDQVVCREKVFFEEEESWVGSQWQLRALIEFLPAVQCNNTL